MAPLFAASNFNEIISSGPLECLLEEHLVSAKEAWKEKAGNWDLFVSITNPTFGIFYVPRHTYTGIGSDNELTDPLRLKLRVQKLKLERLLKGSIAAYIYVRV